MGRQALKVLADTSVLVAAMVEAHPAHARAFPWLKRAQTGEIALVVCTHTLAELYAVLTTLPVQPRISPDVARRLIRVDVEAVGTIVDLSARDYQKTLDSQASLGLSGGTTYDALAAHAAQKVRVDKLITLNEKDFARVWPDGSDRIVAV